MQDFIVIGKNKFPTLLAVSFEEQTKGLMFNNDPFSVMSFVYGSPRINKFWMKNVKYPLDIIFANKGIILNICKGEANSTTIIGNDKQSDLVVELPYGFCEKFDIKVGQPIKINYSLNGLSKLSNARFY